MLNNLRSNIFFILLQDTRNSTIYIHRQYCLSCLKEEQHRYHEKMRDISKILCFYKRTLVNHSRSFLSYKFDVLLETYMFWKWNLNKEVFSSLVVCISVVVNHWINSITMPISHQLSMFYWYIFIICIYGQGK